MAFVLPAALNLVRCIITTLPPKCAPAQEKAPQQTGLESIIMPRVNNTPSTDHQFFNRTAAIRKGAQMASAAPSAGPTRASRFHGGHSSDLEPTRTPLRAAVGSTLSRARAGR